MADWFNITDSAVDPDAPLTSELGYAWRDNPIAISEGSIGAPRVNPKALANGTLICGVVSAGSFLAATSINPFKRIMMRCDSAAENSKLQLSFSTDNGSNWGAWQAGQGTGTSSISMGWIDLQSRTSAVFSNNKVGTGQSLFSQETITIPLNTNAIRFRASTGIELSWCVRLWVLEGRSDV